MGRAFDIYRKPAPKPASANKTTEPTHRRSKRRGQSTLTGFILLIVFAVFLFYQLSGPKSLGTNPIFTPISSVPTTTTSIQSTQTAASVPLTDNAQPIGPTSPAPTPIQTPTPTSTPTPTPTPVPTEIEKSAIKISILNGSSTAGQARLLRDQLVKDGFKISSIALAKNRRTDTLIYYQEGKRSEAEFVASFIPDRLIVFEENSAQARPNDLLIVVGAK